MFSFLQEISNVFEIPKETLTFEKNLAGHFHGNFVSNELGI